MAIKFDEFIKVFLEGASELAKETFGDFEAQAKEDAKAFIEKAETDLKRWTKLLAERKITEQDFSDLVQSKRALAEIHALGLLGISLTKLERFRSGLINLVIDTAFDTLL